MRGKAQTAFYGVAQPRFRDTTFRLVLILGICVGCPLMASPAAFLLSVVTYAASLLSLLLFVGVQCASTPPCRPWQRWVWIDDSSCIISRPSTCRSCYAIVDAVDELLGQVPTISQLQPLDRQVRWNRSVAVFTTPINHSRAASTLPLFQPTQSTNRCR
jgi:hypothetical protein